MTGQQGMHNLGTILKRLEAVTSRLEDVAVSSSSPAPTSSLKSPTTAVQDNLAHIASTGAPPPPPPPPPPAPAAAAEEALSPAVKAYEDEIINGALQEFIEKSDELGGLVQQHSSLLPALCEAQLQFLKLASNHSKPSTPTALGPLLEPQGKAIQAILETKEKLSRSKEGRDWNVCFNTLGEGVPAWGWVQVEPAPAPFVAEMKNAAQFWSDRVIKQYKDSNPTAVAWAKSFAQLLTSLQAYVKQWHTTGVAWNPKASASSSSSAPPPPPPPPAASKTSAPAGGAGGTAALLADLNKGGAVTSGLRKVDASQMTHKNPELRSSSVVPDNGRKAPPLKPKPGAAPAKKPAKLELEDGNKWMVEYQEDNKNIVIDQTELHQTVHIFSCKNSVVKISGKINAVTMVGCKKTAVVLDSAVSSLSVTSSPSFEVQITGQIPTIQVDTTDSGQIYLSKECMNTVEIITSKTSSLNISVPTGQDGDFEEKPVPEQMKSRVVGGKLVTEIIEHAG
uniref:Adenylyl cyclase-associated protein n=1 Tax=Kwoniella bestiolae CBS 10118 TaxID=1296100 RepID=A0A1B9G913_9TREE|nr:adenylyl cyclase-associated protein [Kwoniella bestiolae CBS 10118]OCF27493.1 adenylyl cyclase-associated protein [Kwoniella bestiolae CBS 10118]